MKIMNKNYHLLLVDDDVFSMEGTSQDLSSIGYKITKAQNGEAALALLSKQSFDLVITDLVMGEVDGIEVLKRAKKLYPEIMVIILTGFGDMSSVIEGIRYCADDYLLKPCEPDETHFRVARCLEKLELKKKIRAYEKILPVCCQCKKIRDDAGKEPGTGNWLDVEKYMGKRGNLRTSMDLCPDCRKKRDLRHKA